MQLTASTQDAPTLQKTVTVRADDSLKEIIDSRSNDVILLKLGRR